MQPRANEQESFEHDLLPAGITKKLIGLHQFKNIDKGFLIAQEILTALTEFDTISPENLSLMLKVFLLINPKYHDQFRVISQPDNKVESNNPFVIPNDLEHALSSLTSTDLINGCNDPVCVGCLAVGCSCCFSTKYALQNPYESNSRKVLKILVAGLTAVSVFAMTKYFGGDACGKMIGPEDSPAYTFGSWGIPILLSVITYSGANYLSATCFKAKPPANKREKDLIIYGEKLFNLACTKMGVEAANKLLSELSRSTLSGLLMRYATPKGSNPADKEIAKQKILLAQAVIVTWILVREGKVVKITDPVLKNNLEEKKPDADENSNPQPPTTPFPGETVIEISSGESAIAIPVPSIAIDVKNPQAEISVNAISSAGPGFFPTVAVVQTPQPPRTPFPKPPAMPFSGTFFVAESSQSNTYVPPATPYPSDIELPEIGIK